MSEAFDVVGLFLHAFLGTLLTALACGLLGVHVVARRMVTAGLALPQVAALGIALGLILFSHGDEHAGHAVEGLGPHLVALALEIGAVALIAWPRARAAIGGNAVAGVLFAGAGALTILVMSRSALGMEEVHHLVEGNVLAIGADDLIRLGLVLVPVSIALILGARRLLFCSFDPDMAASLGIRAKAWDVVFQAAFVLTVAVAVHASGTLFVFAFLVLPGASGVALGRSGGGTIAIAAGVAVVSAAAGFVASASALDTPTGPTCAVAAFVGFLVCAALSRIVPR